MTRFIFSSPKFSGSVTFEYNECGRLSLLKIEGSIDDNQHKWILDHVPVNFDKLAAYRGIKDARLIEEKVVITFEMFYEKYHYKRDKKKAETYWNNQMTQASRAAAFYYINSYVTSLKQGVSLKLPVTYLRSEIWND